MKSKSRGITGFLRNTYHAYNQYKLKIRLFNWRRMHWGWSFSMKNKVCVSIQHFHFAGSQYYTPVVSSFKIKSSNLPTNEMSNFIYIDFCAGFSFYIVFRQVESFAKNLWYLDFLTSCKKSQFGCFSSIIQKVVQISVPGWARSTFRSVR